MHPYKFELKAAATFQTTKKILIVTFGTDRKR